MSYYIFMHVWGYKGEKEYTVSSHTSTGLLVATWGFIDHYVQSMTVYWLVIIIVITGCRCQNSTIWTKSGGKTYCVVIQFIMWFSSGVISDLPFFLVNSYCLRNGSHSKQ